MLTLDFAIFGNGHGLAAPYFEQNFYWLPDLARSDRRGTFYTWVGGHGAQLRSFQWTHPVPQERRKLLGRTFRPLQSSRRGLRVDVSWRLEDFEGGILEKNRIINTLKSDLDKGLHF